MAPASIKPPLPAKPQVPITIAGKRLFSPRASSVKLSLGNPRDRSLVTVAALVSLNHPKELAAHLVRARNDGITNNELAALITHLAFYAGFPAAISASAIAAKVLME